MYSTWSVLKLKDELRKRKASTSGKKADLIERLESYDKNNIVGIEDELEDDIPNFPSLQKFRDVNASTNLPLLSKLHIQQFAERFQVPPRGKLLYESRCLVTLRIVREGNFAYFHAQCKAQMKKLLYVVLVKVEFDSGMIEETYCECAAGSGLEAHCKHVFTVLHGIEDMAQHKTIIMYQVCTEKLMQFKKPRKVFFDSPKTSHNLRSKRKLSALLFSPIKEADMNNYEEYVQNLATGYAATYGSNMPYLQTIKPANPYAIENDHAYGNKSREVMLLEELLLKDLNEAKVIDVERKTKAQDQCKDWHLIRKVRITASNFHAVCHSKSSTRQVLVKNIMFPRKFSTRATTHGKVIESVAIRNYEAFLSQVKVKKSGIWISVTHPFLAASPDGLMGDETIVEVKCPFVARYCNITPETVPYLYLSDNGDLQLKKKHKYYTQIQGQCFCTKRKYCNLLVYTFKDMVVVYIERDEEFIDKMVSQLKSFYKEYLEPSIFHRYLYKEYDSIMC